MKSGSNQISSLINSTNEPIPELGAALPPAAAAAEVAPDVGDVVVVLVVLAAAVGELQALVAEGLSLDGRGLDVLGVDVEGVPGSHGYSKIGSGIL